jgi:hypothetical protein
MVEQVQTLDCQAVLNRNLPHPEIKQLTPSDHPVLAPGQLGNRSVDPGFPLPRPQSTAYIAVFCGLGGHAWG